MLWISEPEVSELIDLEDAIAAEEKMLALEAKGEATSLPKALGQWERRSMHALGSFAPSAGRAGFKTWLHTPNGAGTIFSLFNTETGVVEAVIESAVMSQLRTAAISGVATKWLGPAIADEMALVGTGKQAMLQVAAVAAVRPIRRLRVFSRTEENRRAFVERAASLFTFDVEEARSIEAATDGAQIVTIVTRAREPFFPASALSTGVHVNAVGAILRGFAEFHQDLFDRAGLVVVDNIANAQSISTEFIERFGPGPDGWDEVRSLSDIVAAGRPRPADLDVSLFKSLGMGVADLALASLIFERAVARGVGREIERMGRSTARWRSARRH